MSSSVLSVPNTTSNFTFDEDSLPGVNLFNEEVMEEEEEEEFEWKGVPRIAVMHVKCMREIERLKR